MPRRAAPLPTALVSESGGVRYLHLDSIWIQGAMRIRDPSFVVLDYVQRMLASLLWLPTPALGEGQAVQLGLGAGALTRFTAGSLGMPTLAVEINPQVIEINRRWFHLPAAAELVIGDAADWLAQAEAASVRLLHVDLYDEQAAAPVLDDLAFYAACRHVLEPGGVMSVNLFGRDASFERSAVRIAESFGADQVWSLRPTREGNTVVVAGRDLQVPQRAALQDRADHLEARFAACGLPAQKWLRMVRPYAAGQMSEKLR